MKIIRILGKCQSAEWCQTKNIYKQNLLLAGEKKSGGYHGRISLQRNTQPMKSNQLKKMQEDKLKESG